MKVKDMIKRLQKLDQEATVIVEDYDGHEFDVRHIRQDPVARKGKYIVFLILD